MNLCGGIVGAADSDFFMPSAVPSGSLEDGVSLTLESATKKLTTPRRRKNEGRFGPASDDYVTKAVSPSARSSKNKKSPSTLDDTPSPLLNPLSKEDLQKSRNRQRPVYAPRSGTMSHSANMKRLESGFRLVWHTSGELEAPNVTMELSPDRSLLRLYEIDPDGGSVIDSLATDTKALDVKLRVQSISRLEMGKPKPSSSLLEGSESLPSLENVPSAKYFSITMSTKTDQQTSVYGFQTESESDRDIILSGLKMLLDQTKASSALKRPKGFPELLSLDQNLVDDPSKQSPVPNGTLSPMQRTHVHSQLSTANMPREKSGEPSQKSERHDDEGTETSLAFFDFDVTTRDTERLSETLQKDVAKQLMIKPETLTFAPRKTPNTLLADIGLRPKSEFGQEAVDPTLSDDDTRDNSVAAGDGDDLRDDNASSSDGESDEIPCSSSGCSSDKVPNVPEAEEVRELSVRILENDSLREESVEVTGSEWFESEEWAASNTTKWRVKHNNPGGRVSSARSGVAIIAHRQGALKHVEDIELMDLAGKIADPWCADDICTNALAGQMAEPWCTDDICGAALKDVAETCKGIFDIKHQAEVGKKTEKKTGQREIVEDYIAGVLGAPSAMATMLSVRDVWNSATATRAPESEPTVNRIQNRASVLNAPAYRLQQLRNEMTFEAAGRLSRKKLQFVQTVASNEDVEVSRIRKEKQKGSTRSRPEPSLVDNFDSSALLQQVVGNIVSPESVKKEEEIIYYDSDPESSRLRTYSRGPRRVYAERSNETEDGPRRQRKTLIGIPMDRMMAGRRWKKMDEALVSDLIEAMKNEKLTLMWHPTQTKQCSNRSPLCVKVWIESGVYLVDGTFLLPKLTWVALHERNLHARSMNVSKESPERLDLLDVCRVRESEAVDRRLHPFARADHSFIIQTQNEVFLFEAESKEERGRIVNGLKLVIARLASLLMLRDLRAVDEFFGTGSVPGEAPAWTSGHGKSADSDDKNNL